MQQYYIEDIYLGMEESIVRVLSNDLVTTFAKITGDINPLHLDDAYAATTIFKKRVVHGAMLSSLVSAVLGTRLPGYGAIYLSQNTQFLAPVYIDDEVITVVKVSEVNHQECKIRFGTECFVGDKKVLTGEALLVIPRKPFQTS